MNSHLPGVCCVKNHQGWELKPPDAGLTVRVAWQQTESSRLALIKVKRKRAHLDHPLQNRTAHLNMRRKPTT